ncbi:MAG: 50S ribosomal protein L11 methyltransferase [Pseudomonadota bacterium]
MLKTQGVNAQAAFIKANTELLAPPLVPELRLHLASETVPLWRQSEEDLARQGLDPPFWAFAWAGGQALARYILDTPSSVYGHSVLDFGAGSGLVGIAAGKAGARTVICADIDPMASTACALNAAANGVSLMTTTEDLVGTSLEGIDVVLAGDMCYEEPLASTIAAWLRDHVAKGRPVLIGDPKRHGFPAAGVEKLEDYAVETPAELEDMALRRTAVWRLSPA